MLAEARGDWSRIHERAAVLKARFGVVGLSRLERVLERFAWLLRRATAPRRFGAAAEELPTMSNFRYHMLRHEVVADGPSALARTLQTPGLLVSRSRQTREDTQLWILTLMRYDQVWVNVRCFRAAGMGRIKRKKGLPSVFEYYDFLVQQTPPDEEVLPVFTKHPDGEFTCPGYVPSPPLATPRQHGR